MRSKWPPSKAIRNYSIIADVSKVREQDVIGSTVWRFKWYLRSSVDMRERLSVVGADGEAGGLFLDGPGRRGAAGR